MKKVHVKSYRRKKTGGGYTNVKQHVRLIRGGMHVIRKKQEAMSANVSKNIDELIRQFEDEVLDNLEYQDFYAAFEKARDAVDSAIDSTAQHLLSLGDFSPEDELESIKAIGSNYAKLVDQKVDEMKARLVVKVEELQSTDFRPQI